MTPTTHFSTNIILAQEISLTPNLHDAKTKLCITILTNKSWYQNSIHNIKYLDNYTYNLYLEHLLTWKIFN
jgi:hypothetical protein